MYDFDCLPKSFHRNSTDKMRNVIFTIIVILLTFEAQHAKSLLAFSLVRHNRLERRREILDTHELMTRILCVSTCLI